MSFELVTCAKRYKCRQRKNIGRERQRSGPSITFPLLSFFILVLVLVFTFRTKENYAMLCYSIIHARSITSSFLQSVVTCFTKNREENVIEIFVIVVVAISLFLLNVSRGES